MVEIQQSSLAEALQLYCVPSSPGYAMKPVWWSASRTQGWTPRSPPATLVKAHPSRGRALFMHCGHGSLTFQKSLAWWGFPGESVRCADMHIMDGT